MTNPPRPGFCVLYRWRLDPALESSFRDGWHTITEHYLAHAGSLGSRLHKCDDGTWAAYAQWPSREAWERASETGGDPASFEHMRAAVIERFDPILLDVDTDLLA